MGLSQSDSVPELYTKKFGKISHLSTHYSYDSDRLTVWKLQNLTINVAAEFYFWTE
jgi:hypothetical protein